MARIEFGHGAHRQIDLVKTAVLHAPEPIAPGRVESFDRAVAALQPTAKGAQRVGRIRADRVVTAKLVVGLPASNAFVLAVTLCKGAGNAGAFLAIDPARNAIVTTRAKAAAAATLVDRQDLRGAINQPFGRCRCRRPDHHPETGASQRCDRAA